MTDLPEHWSDEPWPLDDPVDTPSLRPTNWSDTHTDPPQVADLADEAWEYAMDHGCSMSQALADLQHRELYRKWVDLAVLGPCRATGPELNGINVRITAQLAEAAAAFDDMFAKMQQTLAAKIDDQFSSRIQAFVDRADADRIVEQLKRDPMPRRTLDRWSFEP